MYLTIFNVLTVDTVKLVPEQQNLRKIDCFKSQFWICFSFFFSDKIKMYHKICYLCFVRIRPPNKYHIINNEQLKFIFIYIPQLYEIQQIQSTSKYTCNKCRYRLKRGQINQIMKTLNNIPNHEIITKSKTLSTTNTPSFIQCTNILHDQKVSKIYLLFFFVYTNNKKSKILISIGAM
jgi:hypothetical protein